MVNDDIGPGLRICTWVVGLIGWALLANEFYDGSNLLEAIIVGFFIIGWAIPVMEAIRAFGESDLERMRREGKKYSPGLPYTPPSTKSHSNYSEGPGYHELRGGRSPSHGQIHAAVTRHRQIQQQNMRRRPGM